MKVYISIILILISIVACNPKVNFKSPMPPEVEEINTFPDEYCGLYFFESDSSRVMVTQDMITTETLITYKTPMKRVEESENCAIVDGGIHIIGRKECFAFDYINEDTILVKITETDTIFKFSENQVAKIDDKNIYLNYMGEKNEWMTFVMRPIKNDTYNIYIINIPNKEKNVRSITSNYTSRMRKDSTIIYTIDPSPREFNKTLRRKYLKLYEKVIPVNFEIQHH